MWLGSDQVDEYTKKELISIRDNAEEIEDRFYTNLEFGTGGLRGVMGAGTNRMNIYTVRMATQGIANYLAKIGISGLPQSNVLYYDLEDGAWACVRPSGTEPKIKLYYGIKGVGLEDADAKLEALQTALVEKLNKLAE